MSSKRRLWEMVEKAAKAVSDSDGHFEAKPHADEILARMGSEDTAPDVRILTDQMTATSLASKFVNHRNPKPSSDTPSGTLFDPGGVLPLGSGRRVWMDQATTSDVLAWAAVSTNNLANVATAEAVRQTYASKRIEAWRDHPDWRLGELERKVFDYEEPPDDDGDDSPDDDDD